MLKEATNKSWVLKKGEGEGEYSIKDGTVR